MCTADALPPRAPEADAADSDPVVTVRGFLLELIKSYRRLLSTTGTAAVDSAVTTGRLTSLVLAESAIRLSWPPARQRARPRQVVVIGPTQAGKSTIVNLLAGTIVTGVSPLAGFTVHPQGCWILPDSEDAAWADDVFPGWRRCEPGELDRDDLQAYALHRVDPPFALSSDPQAAAETTLPPCVLWDTPDFDSLSAGEYQGGVLAAAALADVYLLVLSKEKYSDLSVWNMLRLLEPLGRPLIVVLNKLTPDSAGVLTDSLRQRLTEFTRSWGAAPIIPIDYCPRIGNGAPADGHDIGRARAAPLMHAVTAALEGPRPHLTVGLRKLVRERWQDWTVPVRAEHAAIEEWNQRVEEGVRDFLSRYQRDYLNHPHRYDAFRRAAVELLHLLEVPKLSGWISKAREVATWPVRQLWQTGRAWRDARRGDAVAAHAGAEAVVLVDALEALLTSLQRDLARRSDPAAPGYCVWHAVGRRLQEEETRLRESFRRAMETHHAQVTREIQAAASALYEDLRRHPTRLAALRGARATIDIGAMLLAIKTGGLSPLDALWAPATFAFSSLLVEGFAGVQMAGTSRELKKRQQEAVQTTLVGQVLAPELRDLTNGLDDQDLMGISVERLDGAGRALQAWEQQGDD